MREEEWNNHPISSVALKEYIPMGDNSPYSQFHDCATCDRKGVDNQESDEDGACGYCGAYFCYRCVLGESFEKTGFQPLVFSMENGPNVGDCCIRQAMSEGFLPECGIEVAESYFGHRKSWNEIWEVRLLELTQDGEEE
tara:strand:- start:798 stop:1214 length:417 start_codon:yes stop_codon:yes gene_type:complete